MSDDNTNEAVESEEITNDDNTNETEEITGMKRSTPFFQKKENIEFIQNIIDKIKSFENQKLSNEESEKTFQSFILKNSIKISINILNQTERYDEFCKMTIAWEGKDFIEYLAIAEQKGEIDFNLIKNIFIGLYSFYFEYRLYSQDSNDYYNNYLSYLEDNIYDNIDFFSKQEKNRIVYINLRKAGGIFREIICNKNFNTLLSLGENMSKAEAKIKNWNNEFREKEEKIDILKKKLETYETAFNFVGLYNGFNDLSKNKNIEKYILIASLILMGFIVIVPLASEITLIAIYHQTLIKYKDIFIFAIFPMIAFELILIYFFRILLVNYKSVKALLIQIELRKTLCQFIQNYADYSKMIKEKDSTSLEKFENLIFSGLIMNEEKLPSTFDGAEQIANIIKSMKKG